MSLGVSGARVSRTRSSRLARCVVLATAASAWMAAPAAQAQPDPPQRPTFRASTDAVVVNVSVRDGRRAVTDLTATDFALTDNGVAQRVTDASYGRLPIDVTIVLDISYSVTGTLLQQLRAAVRQLMADLEPDDQLRLIQFNMRISRIVDLTNDAAVVDRAIAKVTAGGGSSVFDAAAVGLVSASAAAVDRRQLIVLFSDGADSTSLLTAAGLLRVAQRTNASMTFVLPDYLFTSTSRLVVAGAAGRLVPFTRVAEATGGAAYPAGGNLTATFRRALEEFRSSYVLHFTPQGVDRLGEHTLEVDVPGRSGLTIRARRGYFGG